MLFVQPFYCAKVVTLTAEFRLVAQRNCSNAIAAGLREEFVTPSMMLRDRSGERRRRPVRGIRPARVEDETPGATLCTAPYICAFFHS